MRSVFPVVLLTLVTVLLAAGCTGGEPAAPPQSPAATIEVPMTTATPTIPPEFLGRWTLTTFGIQYGTKVQNPTTEITLTLNPDGSLTGWGGCNNIFGSYSLNGIQTSKGMGMNITNLGSTKKYCQVYSNQEDQYISILGKTYAYSGDGYLLVLTATTEDTLVFKRPPSVAVTTDAWNRGY